MIQEVGYYHGGGLEAIPARRSTWIPESDTGPHFRDDGEVCTGAFNWFRPWDIGYGRLTINWPREWEGGTHLLRPEPTAAETDSPQLSLSLG